MFNECLYIWLRHSLTLPQNFLDQNDPESKYQCKNELIYIRDFEAIQKTHSCVLSGLNNLSFNLKFLNQYLLQTTQAHSVVRSYFCFLF